MDFELKNGRHYWGELINEETGECKVIDTLDLVTETVYFDDFVHIYSDTFINQLFALDSNISFRYMNGDSDTQAEMLDSAFNHDCCYESEYSFPIKDGRVSFNDDIIYFLKVEFRGKTYALEHIPEWRDLEDKILYKYNGTQFGFDKFDGEFRLDYIMEKDGELHMGFDHDGYEFNVTVDYNNDTVKFYRDFKARDAEDDLVCALSNIVDWVDYDIKEGNSVFNGLSYARLGERKHFIIALSELEFIDFKDIMRIYEACKKSYENNTSNDRGYILYGLLNGVLHNINAPTELKKYCTKELFLMGDQLQKYEKGYVED